MSNYHIRTQEDKQKAARVVFHVPVPATGTNEAGVAWRDAVVAEQGGSANIDSVLPSISAEEDTQLKAGEIIELTQTVRFSSINLTDGQRKTEIEQAFSALESSLIAEKQVTLKWIGYEGDVA